MTRTAAELFCLRLLLRLRSGRRAQKQDSAMGSRLKTSDAAVFVAGAAVAADVCVADAHPSAVV